MIQISFKKTELKLITLFKLGFNPTNKEEMDMRHHLSMQSSQTDQSGSIIHNEMNLSHTFSAPQSPHFITPKPSSNSVTYKKGKTLTKCCLVSINLSSFIILINVSVYITLFFFRSSRICRLVCRLYVSTSS